MGDLGDSWMADGVFPLLKQYGVEYGTEFMARVLHEYGFALFHQSLEHQRRTLDTLYARMLAE